MHGRLRACTYECVGVMRIVPRSKYRAGGRGARPPSQVSMCTGAHHVGPPPRAGLRPALDDAVPGRDTFRGGGRLFLATLVVTEGVRCRYHAGCPRQAQGTGTPASARGPKGFGNCDPSGPMACRSGPELRTGVARTHADRGARRRGPLLRGAREREARRALLVPQHLREDLAHRELRAARARPAEAACDAVGALRPARMRWRARRELRAPLPRPRRSAALPGTPNLPRAPPG